MNQRYKTIYADPPWAAEHGCGSRGGARGANRHYPLMKTEEIAMLAPYGKPVKELAEDSAHLYLWATNATLPTGFQIMEAWGFRYITCITWAKDRWGIGQYFRGQTEHLLFGVCGQTLYKNITEAKPSMFGGMIENSKRAQGSTLVYAPREEHSRKPAVFRSIIERVSYPPYLELFSRQRANGWDSWGNENLENSDGPLFKGE